MLPDLASVELFLRECACCKDSSREGERGE